jgi:heat shock protein HtpX
MSSGAKTGWNYFKTAMLMAALTAVLVLLGGIIGGTTGLIVMVIIAVAFNFAMYWMSGPMALKMSRAVAVTPEQAPELHAMVDRLAARAGCPKPGVYVTPDQQANAFACGRNPKHAAIAVTEGIQYQLSARELEGVVAHEMAHIKNRDILIASVAAMAAGAIAAVANWLQFSLIFGGGDDEGGLSGIAAIAAMIIAPIAATMIQLAISRGREYEADRTGAELMGETEPLASALEKLQAGAERVPMDPNPATAQMYIVNPFASFHGRGITKLFSTHPPMDERIRRLRAMGPVPAVQAREAIA